MLWLRPIPWVRWGAVTILALLALWFELSPSGTIEVPVAIRDISPGEALTLESVQLVEMPEGSVEPAALEDVVTRGVLEGEPIVASHVSDRTRALPEGWWVVPIDLPTNVRAGQRVKLVVVESGDQIEGVVARSVTSDPFGAPGGGVAIPSEAVAMVAPAAANGRVTVLISTD